MEGNLKGNERTAYPWRGLYDTGLMTTAVMYLIQVLVVDKSYGRSGLYQAAATFPIFTSRRSKRDGMDFYPRLTAVAADDEVCNRMVNEQTELAFS